MTLIHPHPLMKRRYLSHGHQQCSGASVSSSPVIPLHLTLCSVDWNNRCASSSLSLFPLFSFVICSLCSYGLRYIAKVLKNSIREKFPDATEEELLKVDSQG